MAQQDQRGATAGPGCAASAMEGGVSAINATSKNMQAIAGEIFEISKQSFEHATQTLEKLRSARGVEEVVAIQTNFVKEAFENSAKHARKFSELMAVFPSEITKTYQDAWLQSVKTAAQTTEKASQTAAEHADRMFER